MRIFFSMMGFMFGIFLRTAYRLMVLAALVALLLLVGCDISPELVRERYPESMHHLEDGMRRTDLRSHTFELAARRARREGEVEAAALFAAVAASERVMQRHYAAALRNFGGGFRPPVRRVIYIASTSSNLRQLLGRASQPDFMAISQVLEEGNRYVARLMIRNAASQNRARRAAEQLLFSTRPAACYRVCPACGYLSDEEHLDPYCPQCHLSQQRFLRFCVD